MSTNPNPLRLRADLLAIVAAGVEAVDPYRLVLASLAQPPPDLTGAGLLRMVAVGKAAGRMGEAFAAWAGPRIDRGVVIAPGPPPAGRWPWPVDDGASGRPTLDWLVARHPSPDRGSETAAHRALDIAADARRDDATLVVLLSGGASSLMTLPATGLHLDEKAEASRLVMHAGAAISDLNAVRKHLSAIKGGRLAAAAAASVTLAVSDVVAPVADDPSVIGSGPTVPDPSTFRDALDVVRRFGLAERLPGRALAILEAGARGDLEDTIKPGDPRLARSRYCVIGNRLNALAGARTAAEARGYAVVEIDEVVIGEARVAGERLAQRATKTARGQSGPLCLLAAGETTVTVRGRGLGGRNQELALAAALAAAGHERFALASVGTDGIDGPTDAAGALVDPTTLERAAAAGLGDPGRYLEGNDAYRFFDPLGDLIKTGPTGTNVGDLQVALIA